MDHIDEVLAMNALDNIQFLHPIQAALMMGKKTLNRYYSKTDNSNLYQIAMSKSSIHWNHYSIINYTISVLHP